MKIRNSIRMSYRVMRANKVRTGLTVLGMVIGIAAVIVVFSAGEGIRGLILGQVESFGTNFIQAEVRLPSSKQGTAKDMQSGQAMAMGVQVTTMTLEDKKKIDQLPNVTGSYAGIQGQTQVAYGSELRKVYLLGVNASFYGIDNGEIASGRFFDDSEDKTLAQVVVLGSNIKEKLFGDTEALGKSIRLHKSKYQVVGVMKKRGGSGMMNMDDWIFIPVETAQKKILGINYVYYILTKVADLDRAEDTAEDIRAVLRTQHDITDPAKDDFRVSTVAELMSMLGTITGAITLLLLAIVSISLVVGGVGIMNIMYVAVTERTAEIGLRKAVGAKYRDILNQFLIEAVMVTLIGGVIGILIGVGLSALLSWMANHYLNLGWKFAVPLKAFIVSIGFSAAVGLVFGVYPARKAAKLDPIEALRAE